MSNSLFSAALNNKTTQCPPIWLMRQAGRYQHSYQELRKKYSFETICKTPELACKVAVNAVNEFDYDVAILFSDILFPLEALGGKLHFSEKGTPMFELDKLESSFNGYDIEEKIDKLRFQETALSLTRATLPENKSLIGFIGAPFTLFAFAYNLIHINDFTQISQLVKERFEIFSNAIIPILKYSIKAQLAAGAEAIIIFDSLANKYGSKLYLNYGYPAILALTDDIKDKVIYFPKGVDYADFSSFSIGLAIDSSQKLSSYISFPHVIQGNFNQELLLESEEILKTKIRSYLNEQSEFKEKHSWICSLGHGILPATPEKNVHIFIETVREYFS